VFTAARVLVFCDGDFWHGRNWPDRKRKLLAGNNSTYWVAKIEANIARDVRVTSELIAEGWQVIRLWETDVLRDPAASARRVASAVGERRPPSRDVMSDGHGRKKGESNS
jgi:DNA mismatch endonuclease (patch repair protein)